MASQARLILLVGVAGNLLAILVCEPMLRLPPGTVIKPMTMPCCFLIIGAFCPVLRTAIQQNKERPVGHRVVLLIGSTLCFTPFPLAVLLFNIFAAIQGVRFG